MFERMKAVAKRSNPFVRGFTKPPPHIVQTLSFPQHLGEALPPNSQAKKHFYVAFIYLIVKFEGAFFLPSHGQYVCLLTSYFILFSVRGRLEFMY